MKRAVILLTILLASIAASVTAAQTGECSLGGWVNDKDKGGTNVRATPSTAGKVVTIFPFAAEDGEQAMVEIVGFENGWLRIRTADTVDGANLLSEPAWISAKLVTATVETKNNKPAALFSRPKRSSARAGTIPNNTPITIAGFDCFGYKVSYRGKTGWLAREDVCGNPVTTCP